MSAYSNIDSRRLSKFSEIICRSRKDENMEAVPRLPMLSFDLKTSPENPAFGPKLKQYIADCYREDPETYNNEIHQLESLRSAAVRPAIDKSGCIALKRYFSQLRGLQSRFPMAKGQPAAITFAWRDLFANIVCPLADIRFEMVCILYNIGALHCKLGTAEPRTTPESMKSACTNFQIAVWTFQHLKEHYPQPSGVDLSPEIMKLFQDICLAQAQECILEKSMQDSRKPGIVGAIGMQAIQHYKTALSALESSQLADLHETIGQKNCSSWIKFLSFKIAYVTSIVYLFQGMQSEEQQKMGERVAYFQIASDKLQEARKLSKGLFQIDAVNEALTFTNDVVEGKRKAAKNENEFIYHEEIPDKDLLSEPKAASLAKGIPINFSDSEISGTDIFSRLVPMRAHEASSMYSEEKAKLLRKITNSVEVKDAQLNEFMSSLQLDEINVLNKPERLPQELVDMCASLSVKNDVINNLIETMNTLADIHTEVDAMFTEIKNMIEEEEKCEKEFQQIMGKRPPSNVTTELSREANKYLDAHNKANESNQTLHKAMTLHLTNLKLLKLPLDELDKHVPSIEAVKSTINTTAIVDMQVLVEKVNEMCGQRSMLVLQLREAVNADDITSQLLTRTGESLDEVFKQEIEKHNKIVSLIEQNMSAQENILKALTDAYAKYAPNRKIISDVLRKKDAFFTAMSTSYETYEDLMTKSMKGIEFYRKLSSTVSRLLSRLKSICKVQQEERTQLLASNMPKHVKNERTLNNTFVPVNSVNTINKEEVPSGPKLKDYLPYMKNRNDIKSTNNSNTAEAFCVNPLYPPYVRPAPLGSEGTNDPLSSKYTDLHQPYKSHSSLEYDAYKGYQYFQPNYGSAQLYTDQVTFSQNIPDPYGVIDPKIYQNMAMDPKIPFLPNTQPQNFVQNPINENLNIDSKTSQIYNKISDPNMHQSSPYNINTAEGQTYISQYGPGLTNMNIYNPVMATYEPQDYNNSEAMKLSSNVTRPLSNVNVSEASFPNQAAGNNFTTPVELNSNSTSFQNDTNKMINQMQNINLSSMATNQNAQNMYGVNYSMPSQNSTYQSVNNIPVNDMYSTPIQSVGDLPSVIPQQGLNINPAHISSSLNTAYSKMNYPTMSNTFNSLSSQPTGFYQEVSPNFNNTVNSQNQYVYQNMNTETTPLSTDVKPQISDVISSHATEYLHIANTYNPETVPVNTENTERKIDGSVNQPVINYDSPDNLPIKSHVQRDFLPKTITNVDGYSQYQTSYYNTPPSTINQEIQNDGINPPQQSNDFSNSYQNHPGYSYNTVTGSYDYNYGYQNSTVSSSQETVPPTTNQMSQNLYTSAGTYGTIQTSSTPIYKENAHTPDASNVQYYSLPYGHQTNVNHDSNISIPEQNQNVNSNEQKSDKGLTYMNSNDTKTVITDSNQGKNVLKSSPSIEETSNSQSHDEKQPSTMDLLSGLDFTVEQVPLTPEIRVPPVSECVIRKAPMKPVFEQKCVDNESDETLQRPLKRDVFSNPSLLNTFTQEVKNMQVFVDGFTKKTHSGITMLDSKWKKIQDNQAKENQLKTLNYAKSNIEKNVSPDVVTYDDSRVILKEDLCSSYVNASHLKQIASWCVPLIISDLPAEDNYHEFWHMVLQQKVTIMICLLSEIELQGKFYGPTSKSQILEFSSGLSITLDEINCNVNWTERKLIVSYKKIQHKITHFQINVFPARVVSAPLVMLVDKILNTKDENVNEIDLPVTLVHCNTGAGRSALIVLLIMVMCQVRAGYVDLRDMLDSGISYLCNARTNVLEDTKYIVDIYRTVLFYVQGVLCSGTVMFNGEAVSVPSGASIPPPLISSHSKKADNINKFSKESFEEMKQAAGLMSGNMQDPLSYLDPMWSLKKRKD